MRQTELFQPRTLRGCKVYPDLSGHKWTSEEQDAFLWLSSQPDENGHLLPLSEWARRFNLNRNTVGSWAHRHSLGQKLTGKRGRPSLLDTQAHEDILRDVKRRRDAHDCMKLSEFLGEVSKVVEDTACRRSSAFRPPCARTAKRVQSRLDLRERTAQRLSRARLIACSDIRMTYSLWIMLKACAENLPPQVLWNFDATTFQVSFTNDEKVLVVGDGDEETPASSIGDSVLEIGVKWIFMASASSHVAPFVFVICVNDMDSEAFLVFEVDGLAWSRDPGSTGYLVFCKTRNGNAALFQWFLTNVVIPTVTKLRDWSFPQVKFKDLVSFHL